MQKLINKWKKLNEEANILLDEHTSFRSYNNIRLKMDKIENTLCEKYDVDIYSLLEGEK